MKKVKICFLLFLFVFLTFSLIACEKNGGNTHTHEYGTEYEHDETYHWQKCTGCGELTTKEAHKFSEWVVTVEATEEHDGEKERTCSVCKLKETAKFDYNHEHTIVHHDKVNPTCTEDGFEEYYECSSCHELFSDKEGTKTIANPIVINALGHDYGSVTYTLNPSFHDVTEDNLNNIEVTATRVCSRDSSHVESETVKVVVEIIHEADCDTPLTLSLSASFSNSELGSYKLESISIGNALNHEYGEVTYTWNSDNTEVTATRVCSRDSNHKETETVKVSSTVTQRQTCTDPELVKLTAEFKNTAFATQTKENIKTKEALGHEYGEVTYTWNSDNTEVTATRVCKHDSNHKETETGKVDVKVTQQQTCTLPELATLSVSFNNKAFLTQTKENVQIKEALGHNLVHHNGIDPTCTTDGTSGYDTCSRCDYETENVIVKALGHHYVDEVTAPTCLSQGYTTHTCDREGCTEKYVDAFVTALGHDWDHDCDCDHGHSCKRCDATEPALGHDYKLLTKTSLSCTVDETETYECSRCHDKYTDTITKATGHKLSSTEKEERLLTGSKCEYVLIYECETCHEEIEGAHVFHHHYIAEVAVEATCTTPGKKVQTCSDCNDKQESVIPINPDAHNWVLGEVVNGQRTDTCSLYNATRTVTILQKDQEINVNNLKDTEVELDNANMKLDDGVIDTIGDKNIKIQADKLEGEERDSLNLDQEKLNQIGDNPVYNFAINDGTQNISTFGENNYITITLPYELKEGEDVDSIAIWFINDSGELESIKAEYSNGYVTFKTNHFSYYTVTRLTPAERCELYGHNYAEQTIKGDCVTNSYILKVCIRCHKVERVDLEDATGHEYEETKVEPTCTENGYVIHTCKKCGDTYREVIKALGHDYKIVDSVDATCSHEGYVKYECSHCHSTYEVTSKMLEHTFEKTVVKPDCTTEGYDQYTCSVCGTIKKENIVPALGHKYQATWAWTDDLLKATLTLTCANDETHTITIDAKVVVVEHELSCSSPVSTEYIASVKYGDDEYKDTKTSEPHTIPHTEGSEWKYNEKGHYHVCTVCGAELELVEHEFEKTTIKAPTCVDDGIDEYKCICGYSYQKKVPHTNQHTYVDGVCSVCGREENSCDHELTTYKKIDLSQYGYCGGTLFVDTCECGEREEIILDISEIDCEGKWTNERGISEDGDEYYLYTFTCNICHCYYKEYVIRKEEGCSINYYVTLTFYNTNDDVALEYDTIEYHDNHDGQLSYIEFADYGCCGGHIYRNVCTECGETVYVGNISPTCDIEFTEETIEIEGGTCERRYGTCSVCGLTILEEYSEIKMSLCRVKEIEHYYVTVGDKVLLDYTDVDIDFEHDFDVEIQMLGDTCEDGVIRKYTCKECGYVRTYKTQGHETNYVEFDLSDYSTCGGVIAFHKCRNCGCVTDMPYGKLGCSFDSPTIQEITDENGIVHKITHQVCKKCGLVWEYDSYVVKNSECIETNYTVLSIYKDNELIFTVDICIVNTHHDYDIEYELVGETCDDGVIVKKTCKICGKVIEERHFDHDYLKQTKLDFKDNGGCDEYIIIESCACGERTHVNYDNLNSHMQMYETKLIYDSEKDIIHNINYYRCNNCGLVIALDRYSEKVECIRYEYLSITATDVNGNVIYDHLTFNTNSYEDHNIEYVFNLHGTSCEDGVDVIEKCRDCDYTYSYEIDYHRTFTLDYIDLVKYGFPESYISVYGCPCGDQRSVNLNIRNSMGQASENSNGRTKYKYYRNDTSYVIFIESYGEKIEGSCKYYSYYDVTIKNGDEVVFNKLLYGYGYSHKYIETYEFLTDEHDCEKGILCTYTCELCGNTYTNTYYYHRRLETSKIDLSEYGINGYISVYECPCGKESNINWGFDWMDYTTSNHTDENGVLHYIRTYTFANTENTIVYEEASVFKPEECLRVKTITYSICKGTEILKQVSYTSSSTEHTIELLYEFLTDDHDCEKGVRIIERCKYCDYQYSYESHSHSTINTLSLDLTKYGFGGYINVYECPCGKEHYVNRYIYNYDKYNSNSYLDDDGVYHYVNEFTSATGYKIIIDYYSDYVPTECRLYTRYDLTIYNGNELIKHLNYSEYESKHDYGNTYEFLTENHDCSEGVKIIRTCKYCGKVRSYETHYHEAMLVESYDLTKYGSKCGGTIELFSCPCGQEQYYNNNFMCDMNYNYEEEFIPSAKDIQYVTSYGYLYGFYPDYHSYACAVTNPEVCGFIVRYATIYEYDAETCTYKCYNVIQIGYDKETDTCQKEVRILRGTGEAHEFEESNRNYEENGLSYSETSFTCKHCGAKLVVQSCYDSNYSTYIEKKEYTNEKATGYSYKHILIETKNNYIYASNPENCENAREVTETTESDKYNSYSYTVYMKYKGYLFPTKEIFREDNYESIKTYEYNFAEGCKVTITSKSSSDEEPQISYETCHRYTWSYYYGSCTQPYIEKYWCPLCGDERQSEQYDAYGHNWYYDYDLGHYVCSRCHLENITGEDGSVVLENMTKEDDTNYVIGYWNKTNAEYMYFVSVFIGEEQINLEGIEFSESTEYRAIVFSKDQLARALATALAGRDASEYVVQFTFVAVTAGSSFDYGITLD